MEWHRKRQAVYILDPQVVVTSVRDLLQHPQRRAQDLGSRNGLLPAGIPTSKASLQAFCMQYCWSSAAAWETLILSTLASSFSCSTSLCIVLRLEFEDMFCPAGEELDVGERSTLLLLQQIVVVINARIRAGNDLTSS